MTTTENDGRTWTVPADCTGVVETTDDQRPTLQHHGDTCPIHEPDPPPNCLACGRPMVRTAKRAGTGIVYSCKHGR